MLNIIIKILAAIPEEKITMGEGLAADSKKALIY